MEKTNGYARALLVGLALCVSLGANAQPKCHQTTIVEPQPFLGTAEEIIVMADGSVWKDMSYKYLYLYEYYPAVTLCAASGRMFLKSGSTTHEFSLMRIK